MAGSEKSGKLGKRPSMSSGTPTFSGKMSTIVSDNTGKAGSASNRKSAFSVSGGGGMQPHKNKLTVKGK